MRAGAGAARKFPFLFGGTFIEADFSEARRGTLFAFPFLFGGTFIEAAVTPAFC